MDDRARHRMLTGEYVMRLRMCRANPKLSRYRVMWVQQAGMIIRQQARRAALLGVPPHDGVFDGPR